MNYTDSDLLLLATLVGGAGAALVGLVIAPIKYVFKRYRLKSLIKRELSYNIKSLSNTISRLEEFKNQYIQFDRASQFSHFFNFKPSAVIFNALINAGMLYDFMTDDQIEQFNNFLSEYNDPMASFLNNQVADMKGKPKQEAANGADFFIAKYTNFKNDLESIKGSI